MTKIKKSKLLFLIIVQGLVLLDLVRSDQPVDCLRRLIHDSYWNFYVSRDNQIVNLFETNEVCTHQHPNRV